MAPLAPAESIARLAGADSSHAIKVLDIAADHGLFGIAVAKLSRNARIVAQDWAEVLEVAQENVRTNVGESGV
jgi:tRNA1(Val) A37 N6-methylase TrmN6